MAELQFAHEINLTQTFLNTCLGNEPDNELIQFGITGDQQVNDNTQITNSNYTDLTWAVIAALMTQRAISRIGIKNFPQIGACGFFVDKYTGQTTILAPIKSDDNVYSPPTLVIEETTEGIAVTITPPDDITYTCYKVIMRSGYYANEFVVYGTAATLAKPTVIGDYDVFAIGYNEDTGIMSSWSNVVEISITSGDTNWSPAPISIPMSLADLTDVNLVALLNAQSLRYNSTSGKWENADMGDVLTVTLLVANWTGAAVPYTQTISLAGIIAAGYSYVVTPDDDSWYTYGACGIYMEDPTTDGSITFNATSAMPAVALTVNILKVRAS